MSYPSIILVAILSTANHYVLDAVAGLFVVVVGWHINGNMLVLDYIYYPLRVHKPSRMRECWMNHKLSLIMGDDDDEEEGAQSVMGWG